MGSPERNVVRVDIDGLPEDAPELALSKLLDEYRSAREQRYALGVRPGSVLQPGSWSVGLQQRLLSSIEAFARSLKVHRQTVQRHWDKAHEPMSAAIAASGVAGSTTKQTLGFLKPADADDERGGSVPRRC